MAQSWKELSAGGTTLRFFSCWDRAAFMSFTEELKLHKAHTLTLSAVYLHLFCCALLNKKLPTKAIAFVKSYGERHKGFDEPIPLWCCTSGKGLVHDKFQVAFSHLRMRGCSVLVHCYNNINSCIFNKDVSQSSYSIFFRLSLEWQAFISALKIPSKVFLKKKYEDKYGKQLIAEKLCSLSCQTLSVESELKRLCAML